MNFKNKPIFGMIHLSMSQHEDSRILRARREMELLEEEGVDGIIIENYHGSLSDVKDVLEANKSFLETTKLIVGINILPNDYEEALRLASRYNGKFIQMDYVAGDYKHTEPIKKAHFNAMREVFSDIKIFGGVWPKYYYPVKNSVLEVDIAEGKKMADAIVVTGSGTGQVTPLDKIKEFRNHCGEHPLIIGAGLTVETVAEQLQFADGAIVGSCFKKAGQTSNEIDRELVKEFMSEVKKIR